MNWLLLTLMRGVNHQLFEGLGDAVRYGPFMGMHIPERPIWDDGNQGCKLLGSYEHELHGAIERAIERKPAGVVNLGCAEGYYAIGMALRIPAIEIVAQDVDAESLRLVQDYAERNGVADRIRTVSGAHSPDEVARFAHGRALYIVDVEGDELALLDAEQLPLARADIIVECHDFMCAEGKRRISDQLAERFNATHEINRIEPRMPDLGRWAMFAKAPSIMALMALTEKRPLPQCWLAMWAKGDEHG